MNEGTERERGELGRDMFPSVINSVVVSGATILIAIPLATLAAYAFSRYQFLGNGVLLVWILTTQFIPAIVVAIPFFTLFRSLVVFGKPLLGTHLGLIIVNMSIVLPYAIWMIKGFVDALPDEIEEAAFVDGCNDFQILFFISLPLIRPGVLVASVFAFIMSWNEFLFALIIGREMRTMQVALHDHERRAGHYVGVDGRCWSRRDGADLLPGDVHPQECGRRLDHGCREIAELRSALALAALSIRRRQPTFRNHNRPLLSGHRRIPAQHIHRAFGHRLRRRQRAQTRVNQQASASTLQLHAQRALAANGQPASRLNPQIDSACCRKRKVPDISRGDLALEAFAVLPLDLDLQGIRAGGSLPGDADQAADILERICTGKLYHRRRLGGGQGSQSRKRAVGIRFHLYGLLRVAAHPPAASYPAPLARCRRRSRPPQ